MSRMAADCFGTALFSLSYMRFMCNMACCQIYQYKNENDVFDYWTEVGIDWTEKRQWHHGEHLNWVCVVVSISVSE